MNEMTDRGLRFIKRELFKMFDHLDNLLIKIEEIEHKGDEAFTPAERQLSVRLDRRFCYLK